MSGNGVSGAGVIEGSPLTQLVGFRPTDSAYIDSGNVRYHPQDEAGAGNVPFYEVVSDNESRIDFDIQAVTDLYGDIVMGLYRPWGDSLLQVSTDVNIRLLGEESGYDTDVFMFQISGNATKVYLQLSPIKLTDGGVVMTDGGAVDPTQAGLYPFALVTPLVT